MNKAQKKIELLKKEIVGYGEKEISKAEVTTIIYHNIGCSHMTLRTYMTMLQVLGIIRAKPNTRSLAFLIPENIRKADQELAKEILEAKHKETKQK